MKQHILGVSAGYHDAAVTLIDPRGHILFAGHSERYSGQKNDSNLCSGLLIDALEYGMPDHVAYYEKPWLKQLRQVYSGQGLDWRQLTVRQILNKQIPLALWNNDVSTHSHHLSHAAAGFQTSPFERATVVVIDAIGEWSTISILGAEYDRQGRAVYKTLWRQNYPHSIGLFYSGITSRIGLRPLDEEYITMGMAAYGHNSEQLAEVMKAQLVDSVAEVRFSQNLHAGLDADFMLEYSNEDIAGAAQLVVEELINSVMQRARNFNYSSNLVYQGGVALNCLANRNLGNYFENIWIMPCPGDSGSSLGAAALAYGRAIEFNNAYLGYKIDGPYPVNAVVHSLIHDKITGVASGRAEFGPRALGNRSLLADPRGNDIKERVNAIKRRQQFRPFAPVILEELVHEYFTMPSGWHNSRYMQTVARCRRPDLYPAIIHHDGTSRVQTVPRDGSGIRQVLEQWYAATGCPMLLNTSLNIRGEPMVNSRYDADRFEQLYGIAVHS